MPTFVPDAPVDTPTFVPDAEPGKPEAPRQLSEVDQAQIDRTGEIKVETPLERAGSAVQSFVRPIIGYFRQAHEEAGQQPMIGFGDVQGKLGTIPALPENVPLHEAQAGVLNALGEAGASFTSPEGIALLGGVGKLVSAAKAGSGAASWAARAISAWFAAKTAEQAGEQAGKASVEATLPGTTTGEAAKMIAAPVISSAMALGAAEVAKKPLNAAPIANALPTTRSTADALGYLDLSRTDAVAKWVSADDPHQAIVYAKDAVSTATERAANTAANDVLHDLKENFDQSDLEMARKALVPAVEAGASRPELLLAREKLENGTYKNTADLEQAHEYLNSVNFALDHLEELAPAVEKHNAITSAIYEHAQDSGIEFPYRENYVMHAQDFEVPAGFEETMRPGMGQGTAFKKMRVHDTYADSIASGVVPKTPDGIDLLRGSVRATQGAVNRNLWTDALTQMIDPTNGAPILMPRTGVVRPDGTVYYDTPAGYSAVDVGGRPMAVQNGYAGTYGALTEASTVNPTLMKVNATAKSVRLAVDTYHLGRLAAYQAASELSRGATPKPAYSRGLLIGDMPMSAIEDMAAKGELDPKSLPQIREDKAIIDLGVNQGLNAGRIADSLHQEWIQKVPVLGDVNKFIFEQFQRGAIYDLYTKEFRHQQSLAPELPNETIARNVARDVNTRLGNLGSQGLFKSRTAQDMARLVFLAPQWNEALIRSEMGGVKQIAQGVVPSIKSGRIKVGLLGRTAGTLAVGGFAANQLINLWTRGYPTWQNPEEGAGAKLSAWVPDVIGSSHGFFLNPTTLPMEVTHLLSQAYARTGDMRDALGTYFRGRLSSVGQPVADLLLKRDALGRPITAAGAALDAVPVPIAGGAAVNAGKQLLTGQPSESFPGQFQKQAMASFGVRADTAPSPEQRIYSLAADFKREHNIQSSAEFYGGDYTALATALKAHNLKDATQALDDVLQRKTQSQVLQHFGTAWKYPFTGSYAHEVQFFKGLSDEQKTAYVAAQKDRKELAERALKFITNQMRVRN